MAVATTERSETDRFGQYLYQARHSEADAASHRRAWARLLRRVACSRAQVALAWILAKHGVTAPIIGATKIEQLNESIAALDLELTADDIRQLEAPYLPHPVIGF
jgi:aryl-alcohol dehydrogenase-like predicted oxidoreductase